MQVVSKSTTFTAALFVCVAVLLSAGMAHAQFGGVPNNLVVTITPTFPGPREDVTIAVQNYITDLDRADITWYLNGKVAGGGRGFKTFGFTTGAVGGASRITVVFKTEGGERVEKQLVIRPAEVRMLWSANTYTSPFYRGMALPSSESELVITAMPNFITAAGTKINSNNLIYTWKQDGDTLGNKSGVGKKSVVVTGPRLFRSTLISVKVSSADEALVAEDGIRISSVEPSVIFYEKHPLNGVRYENALKESLAMAQEEITVRAEPYFFSAKDVGQLDFEWLLNGKTVPAGAGSRELTLRREEKASGISRLTLAISNSRTILQEAANALLINFSPR